VRADLSIPLPATRLFGLYRWLFIVLLLLTGLPISAVASDSINDLRIRQQNALNVLESSYHTRVRSNPNLIKTDGTVDTDHPEYKQILSDYSKDKSEIQSQFNNLDTRGDELENLQERYGSSLKTTGSSPKDVRADVDISANNSDVAAKIADEWRANGDVVKYDKKLGIYINESKDTTLWQPPTADQLSERQKYHDAFSTPGGKQATNVKGNESVRDPEGNVLDNEKKFIHGAEDLENTDINSKSPDDQLKRDMALKTMGKSVSKSADEVDHDSEVIKQANKLRNYGDKYETGITPLGATPQQQKEDEKKWIRQADQEIQNTKPVAAKKSENIKKIREQVAKTVDKSARGTADKDAEDTAANIRGRNRLVDNANEDARAANEAARKKANLPAAPTPDEKAITRQSERKASKSAADKDSKTTISERSGSAKNSKWKITEERDGDKRTQTRTSTTQNADGSTTQRDSRTDTQSTPGGGKTTRQTKTTLETGADGSVKQTDSTKTTNTRTTKDGKRTSTYENSTTKQDYKGWMPGSTGSTTTDSSKQTTEHEQGGVKRRTDSSTTTTTDDRTGKRTTTHTDSHSTTSTGDDGRKTTTSVTTTTTDKPWQKSRTTTGGYENDLKPGGDPNQPKEGEGIGDPTKVNVKIAGGKLFEPIDEASKTLSTSGAGQNDSGGDYEYDAKIQTGQHSAAGSWEVTANKRGLHAKADINAEANAVNMTATGSAEQKVGDATLGVKGSGTAKLGAEGKTSAEAHLGSDRIAGSLEAKVFVGGKAEAAAEASLSLWGLKLTGKAQGEVSAGAGAEAKVDAELSWTRIRLGAKLSATLGLGAGGGTSVELDGRELITGYDHDALDRQYKAGDSIVNICRNLRSGRLRLPPGVEFSDIRERLQKRADFYAKHPQKGKDGKPISLIDSLVNELGLVKGKGGAYITAHHKQKDWYCTNRPQIEAKVVLPAIVERR